MTNFYRDELGLTEEDLKPYRKDMFEAWIREQIDCWLCERGAWDMWIEDSENDFDEDDWEWIKDNLKAEIVIREVE